MYEYKFIDKIYLHNELSKEVRKAEKWFIEKNYVNSEFIDYEDKGLYVLDNEKIIAIVVYTPYTPYTHLSLIYINKFYRGQGLLKELLKRIDGERLEWGVSIHNLDAIVAYSRLGAKLTKQKYKPEFIKCVFIPHK